MSSSGEVCFPKTLEEFGYRFNDCGKLRKIDVKTGESTDTPFEFNVSPDPSYNQKHYEALGEVITEEVYSMLRDLGLKQLPVPPGNDNSSFIFATEDAHLVPKLAVLIHGTGVVRAGQWARSLIINDSLETGTQIPYIRKAMNLGYGVIIMNTNDNYRLIDGKKFPIEGSSNSSEHASTVWKHYVLPTAAEKILLIAHSFGGVVTMSLASNFEEDFLRRVKAIALTDSVHGRIPRAVSSRLAEYLSEVGRNWVTSSEPLDKMLPEQQGEIQCVSAGTTKHELTSASSIESVFNFAESLLVSGPLATNNSI
ncbi:FAM172 family protein homolog CG10038 [Halyomorpha halys]|uniref:FAM172 family protein homolog CG10038 n=1 Tax=Halyomorpha halys TaxID=286706 RepID=UPI0006D505AB|nr:UPF0528 protein CG10038 [Halyomorpha halys]XP_014289175.1 UPF0528 protein CG10038 [Halyomorpha halys]